jgi:phosphatidylserine/phosphatidylglycerophosphate/cardiolipin synthase-like enzyme
VAAHELAVVRSRVFELARTRLEPHRATATLAWCEDVVQLVASRESARHAQVSRATRADVVFSPGEDCARRIVDLLGAARSTLDVCVFTLTDDRIRDALLGAARRSVAVRVITDDAKAGDLGSDVSELVRLGIPLRTDRAESHMHHKFAIADGQVIVTGSYNWTRQASTQNQENLVFSDDPRLVGAFQREFDALWAQFGG